MSLTITLKLRQLRGFPNRYHAVDPTTSSAVCGITTKWDGWDWGEDEAAIKATRERFGSLFDCKRCLKVWGRISV